MIIYDHRMLEGNPLHYYPLPTQPERHFSYFDRFQPYSPNMTEELIMPHSPQSDSDNSVSSIEISSPKEIRSFCASTPDKIRNTEVRCQWRSCGIMFESLEQLATHVSRVHAASGSGGLFYCGWDGCSRNNKGFNARYKMLVHVRTHTNEKPHQCNQCEKSFSRAENLKIHSRSHSGEKPYVCPVPGCHKAYSNSSDRFKHTRTHQVDKPYQCKIPGCPKRYTDPSSLRKHVKTYKHFVNENGIRLPKMQENTTNDSSIFGNCNQREDCKREEDKPCTCQHSCCKSFSNRTNLLKLGAFIDIKHEEISSMHWNKILEPKIFKPYEILEEQMEIDVPLDLSLRKRQI